MPTSMVEPRDTHQPDVAPDATSPSVCQAWYQAYGEQLYSYLRFHLSSADQAEDLTAEVFLRALRRRDQFDPARGTPKAWLFRIAQNALRDHRRQANRRQLLPIAAFHDLKSDAPSPEERILWEEGVARLLGAMSDLPSSDRQIIALCYGADLSVAEAGEILGLSGGTARTRLWRALGRLRKVLT